MARAYRKGDRQIIIGASRGASRVKASTAVISATASPAAGAAAVLGRAPGVSTGALRPTSSATSISVGGITFSWSGSLTCGYYVDGQAFVVAPSGVTLGAPSPAVTTIEDNGTRTVNGAQVNVETSSHCLDSRFSGYSAALAPSFPYAATVGDCLFKIVSRPAFGAGGDYSSTVRKGMAVEQAALYVVSETPSINAFAPPAVWPGSDKANRPTREADVAAVVAALPSYSTASHSGRITWAALKARIGKFAPLFRFGAYLGYEIQFPFDFWATGSFNYGRYNASGINRTCAGLISDYWTTAEKTEAVTQLIQHGIQWAETAAFRSNADMGPDGGHHQFHYGPIALALWATGQASRLPEFFNRSTGKYIGNVSGQAFTLDSAFIAANCVPHDDTSKAFPWRRRTITGVSGTTITTTLRRLGGTGGDGPNPTFTGLVMKRESDGASANVTNGSANSPSDNQSINITIDAQPSPAFAVNDVIYFESPYALADGQHHWRLRNLDNLFNPSRAQSYRPLNFWSGQHMLATALGIHHPDLDASRGYVEWANQANQPLSTHDFDDHHDSLWEEEIWADHWTTMKAVPSVL